MHDHVLQDHGRPEHQWCALLHNCSTLLMRISFDKKKSEFQAPVLLLTEDQPIGLYHPLFPEQAAQLFLGVRGISTDVFCLCRAVNSLRWQS